MPNGQRLTEELATEIAEDALAHHYRIRGRPARTGRGEEIVKPPDPLVDP